MENEKHRILIYLNIEEYLWGFCFFPPALKHTTGNMVTEPCNRFVCMAYMSQQPAPISPSTMLCLGVHCPLITWLGERREGGGECGSGFARACAVEVFLTLAGCGQLDHQFEFLLTARLKFQPLKIEGNKRLRLSKQPLCVFFLLPALSLFFLSQFLFPGLGSARLQQALV